METRFKPLDLVPAYQCEGWFNLSGIDAPLSSKVPRLSEWGVTPILLKLNQPLHW